MVRRWIFLLLLWATTTEALHAPTELLRTTFLSDHTLYGPGVCGVTTDCQPTNLYYNNAPIANSSYRCYDNTTESQYRVDHGTPLNYTLSSSDFPGFTCSLADAASKCGLTSRFFGDVRTPTSCVCLDPCFDGPTCTYPTVSPYVSFADRLLNYRACVEPYLAPGSVYDTTNKIYLPPSTASTNEYQTWDTEETRCRLLWFVGTALATSRTAPQTQPLEYAKTCPAPCSQFPGGGCPAKGVCYRRSGQEMAVYASTGVPVLKNGAYVNVKMDSLPMDVCCERGWDGFDCNQPIGCRETGCDHNGTCLTTGRSDSGVEFQLGGADIRCINCDPGWTGTFCNVSAPMWTSPDSAGVEATSSGGGGSRRLLQFQDACDIVRKDNSFKTPQAGAVYPEPGRACDCGVQWSDHSVASNVTTVYRILDMGNYDNDFGQLRHRLLSPVRYPTASSLFAAFTPVSFRSVSSRNQARYLCYQDYLCDGFYTSANGATVSFFSLLETQAVSTMAFFPARLHLVDRLRAPTAYTRTLCSNATLDPEWYCSTYPLQCLSIRSTEGVGNMRRSNLTTAEVAELHFRVFGHQVRNSPNPSCSLGVDWLEDVSTCTQALRCVPGLPARNGTGDQQRCGNLTYIESLNPLIRALERINTYPQPFTATIGMANVISEHGQNDTCSCFAPFRPTDLSTYDDCAVDQCGTGLNQGRVNASHVGLGAGVESCECLGKWYTDNSTCIGGRCDWCQLSRCSNFGTVSKNDTCLCTEVFGGAFCDQPVCTNTTTTNVTGLLSAATPQIDCSAFCIPPFEGPYCNLTNCVHGVRSYDGGFACQCPESYLLGDDGRCLELLCFEGHGFYAGNKTCSCRFPWSGDRCEIDGCGESILEGKEGGYAVQALDGDWDCQCNWPFAVSFEGTEVTAFNQTRNRNKLCLSHYCGDWGYPVANWTRPADACNCKLNGYGKPFEDYGMGIFTNPKSCTEPSFDKCPKPCVQADCGLTEAIEKANKTFDSYVLEATVSSLNGVPYCICPLSYNYTGTEDESRKCRPFLPCFSNGNRTIIVNKENGETECRCSGTEEARQGYFTSSASTARCDIWILPPADPVAIDPNDPILNAVELPKPVTVNSSDDLFGAPRVIMITIFAVAGVLFLSLTGGAATGSFTSAGAAAAKASASVAPTTVININASGPVTGVGGRVAAKKTKQGYTSILVLFALCVPWTSVAVAQDVVLGKPGPSYESLYSPDKRRTEWSKTVNRVIQITADFDDQRNANTLFTSSTSSGRPSISAARSVVELDLSEYEVDFRTVLNTASGSLIKSRPFPTFELISTWTYPLVQSNGFSGLNPVRVGDQYLAPQEVTISIMTFYQGYRLDLCWREADQEVRLYSSSNSCPSGYGRTGMSTFAIYAINLCSTSHSCGLNGECFNTAGHVYTDVRNGIGLANAAGTFSLSPVTGDLQRSLMYVTIDVTRERLYTTGNFRRPVFGCKCNDGWTGLHCERQCAGNTALGIAAVPACNGRGTCATPLKTIYVEGTLKTCQCDQCVCENGYGGVECEFAERTHNFPEVYDYRVCCFKSFGEKYGKDCAPRHNPMNTPTTKCTPTWAAGSQQYSTALTPITDQDTCKENPFREPFRGHPYYSEYLQPADVCGEASNGRCWQNQLTTQKERTACWCNHPGSNSTNALPPLRGYYGANCTTRTCTSKTFLWPPYATELTTRIVPGDRGLLTSRCSGNMQTGLKLNNLDNDFDTVCDDAFRLNRTVNGNAIFYLDKESPGKIFDDRSKELWRYNTPGDCVACIPGWGMLPIDTRLLRGTEYEEKYAVYGANGQPNWNGICSERTYHDDLGNVCGGYGVPTYGETMHFKLAGFNRYRSIRSVTGCVCPTGTITLESGICQRSVALDDAENKRSVPLGAVGCSRKGQEVLLSDHHSACSCFVDTLLAHNGPNCNQYDVSMQEFGGDRACLHGQYSYFNGISDPPFPIADTGVTFANEMAVTSNRVTATRTATGADILFRDQVILHVGRNVPNKHLGRSGTFSLQLTREKSGAYLAGKTDGEVLALAYACSTIDCSPHPGVVFGITTEDEGYELWGTFDSAGYVNRNIVGGFYKFQRDFPGMSAFYHYVTFNQGGIMVISTYKHMSEPTPGMNVRDRRGIDRIGFLNIPLTKQLNPGVFAAGDLDSNQIAAKLLSLRPSTNRIYLPPTGILLAITNKNGTSVWGEFDSQGYSDLYHLPLTDPQPPDENRDLNLVTAWNHFLFDGPSISRRFPVFIDRMPDPVDGNVLGSYDNDYTMYVNTQLFYRYKFTSQPTTPAVTLFSQLIAIGVLPSSFMIGIKRSDGTYAYGQLNTTAYIQIYTTDAAAAPWSHWIANHAIVVTPVFLSQELRLMGEEILGQNYNQFKCSCTQESIKQGRVSQDNKCIIGCDSRALDPGYSGSPCSGKGRCLQKPNSWDYGCLCDTTPGIGGSACNVTVLRDRNGRICGGEDRGSIKMPTFVGERQTCDCKNGFAVRYKNASCSEGERAGNCAYTGLCVSGNPDCSHAGANLCTRPGIQGACVQNDTQGDYYCFCREGAFEGQACDKATTPALRTTTGILLSCSGRGTPDPTGTGFCLCNTPYVGYACEIDPTNRPCTFADGTQGQSYVDGESNGLELVFS